MAPFNVKVVIIITGAVNTDFYANAGSNQFQLPSTSRYLHMEETVRKYANGEDHIGIPARQYADKIVGSILCGVKGKVWSCGLARIVRCVVPLMPCWPYVSMPWSVAVTAKIKRGSEFIKSKWTRRLCAEIKGRQSLRAS
jgi:hypothetical protein